MSRRSSNSVVICAWMSASVPPECGSLMTVSGRVSSRPPTESFTRYVPGGARIASWPPSDERRVVRI